MMAKKQGFYWHVHHDVLVEYCYDYDERRRYIANQKPEAERELRLRLFQKVRGNLPKAYVEAWKAYDDSFTARAEAWKALDEACKACVSEIETLHALECPDCPWDGKTIFPVAAAEAAEEDK